MRDQLGLCQWFHYLDFERALYARRLLIELGVRHLRVDLSWADYHRPKGRHWYSWLFKTLKSFELLVCIWHTPPSLSRNGKSNGPPKQPHWLAEFLWEVINEYGEYFHAVELWNEPNNRLKWDRGCDPDWRFFTEMVSLGAGTAALLDKKAVLGGMSPIDGGWLDCLRSHDPKILHNIPAIGVHAFPGQWNEPEEIWCGWSKVFQHLQSHTPASEIWLTEVGRSTVSPDNELRQVAVLRDVAATVDAAERIYWYSLLDLPDSYPELEYCLEGRREPMEHSLGLVTADGRKKPAFFVLKELLQKEISSRTTESSKASGGTLSLSAAAATPLHCFDVQPRIQNRPTSRVLSPGQTCREKSRRRVQQ